jgi:DnaJ-class molecular chaperone
MKCPACNGTGHPHVPHLTQRMRNRMESDKDAARAWGAKCKRCRGTGRVEEKIQRAHN